MLLSSFLFYFSITVEAYSQSPWCLRSSFLKLGGKGDEPLHRGRSTSSSLFLSTSSQQNIVSDTVYPDPRIEPRTTHSITLSLPMGLTLEEMDALDPSYGVSIIGMNSGGHAAKANARAFSSPATDEYVQKCVCIRDKILSVNGEPCHDKSFDEVMELILRVSSSSATSPNSNVVTLGLGRIEGSTVVYYSDTGRCIAAKPGESYGFLARMCDADIEYSCRTGSCGTCERFMEFPGRKGDKDESQVRTRRIFNCVGKVPRGYEWFRMLN